MKNFKKVLALVLVLATLLGLATMASATEYKDADKIAADYDEAVKVLDLIETMQGYPNGEFRPTANITREEAAKLIAIFDNKDSDISTYYTSINPFADEKGRWGESYVGYGYRAGIIAGMNATTFAPTANVTGTQFLKMALVTLGYDQEAEGFVQCCAYSVGQAAQPILSTNYGANNAARIRQALHLALGTSMVFAAFWTGLSELFPQLYIHIFMRPSAEILAIAPAIIRRYSVSFVLLPVNIFSTYYFQSILHPKDSFIVSIARGLLVSGLLIFALPALFAPEAIWWAMPLTELVTSVYAAYAMRKSLTGLCTN